MVKGSGAGFDAGDVDGAVLAWFRTPALMASIAYTRGAKVDANPGRMPLASHMSSCCIIERTSKARSG